MRVVLRRAALAVLMTVLATCGGGGGDGGGGSGSGFSISFDRNAVSMSFDAGDTPATATVVATARGTPSGAIYVGADTPSGRADPNIDSVNVVIVSDTSAHVVIHPAAGLTPGTYTGTLVMQACQDENCNRHHPGSPFNVAYTITVRANFVVTPQSITLSAESSESASQNVAVSLPPGVTSYTVTANDPWASIDQLTPSGFRVTAPPRPTGTYTTTLSLRSGNYVRNVTVVHFATPRQLRLSPAQVDLAAVSGNTAQADLTVVQLTEGQSGISASVTAPWLQVSNVSASGLRVQAASLPSGTYSAELSVVSGTRQLSLPVNYVVTAPPGGDRPLGTTQTSLTFAVSEGATSVAQALGLQRPSWNPAVSVNIQYTQGSNWLTATTRPDNDIELSVNAAALLRGTYQANVVLTGAYPSVPLTVPVTVTVGSGLATPTAQLVVLGSDSPSSALTGSIAVRSNGAASLQWSATSSAPWLRLTQAQGSLGQDVAFEIDTAAALAMPAYTDQQATVSISAPNFTSVQTTVTVRRELAELHHVGPGSVTAGRPVRVIVRGQGFAHIANPASRLSVAGATPTSVSRLSPTSLAVQLPALAAGSYEVSVSNALGVATSRTTLRVLDEQTYTATQVATEGVPFSTLYDPVRQIVYSANSTLSAVRRMRFSNGSWVTDSLAFPALRDIGLSPDGSTLVAVETPGRLHLIDTSSFTVTHTYTMPGPVADTPYSGRGLAVTNDGKVWLSVGSYWNAMYTFDLRSRSFTAGGVTGAPTTFSNGPWFEVSRNGERLVMVQQASNSPGTPILYLDASEGVFRDNPAGLTFFYWTLNGLGDTGNRFLYSAHEVYDSAFGRVGRITLPDAGWWASAAVLSPDGNKVYIYALREGAWGDPSSTTMPRIYVLDSSAAAGAQVNLPVLGSFDLAAYPTCRFDNTNSQCVRPNMTIAPDGKTLFVLGTVGMAVIPVSGPLASQAAPRRAQAQVMKRWVPGAAR